MYNLNWSRESLRNSQKLGTFGEYYAKMSLASYGMSIYTSEVDDHGIDFVAESSKGFLKFQVKTIRSKSTSYVFMKQNFFDVNDDSLYLLLLILIDGEHPKMYAIPASTWKNSQNGVFVYHAYAKPEYGINISKKNMPLLDIYTLDKMIDKIV